MKRGERKGSYKDGRAVGGVKMSSFDVVCYSGDCREAWNAFRSVFGLEERRGSGRKVNGCHDR